MSNYKIAVLILCLGCFKGFAACQNPPAAGQVSSSTQTPSSSAATSAATIGVFVNPKNNQSPQQQAEDENLCYAKAQQETGIDPAASAAAPGQVDKKQGGGAKGAAGGAAGGAAIGAIAGDAGTGAAIGATAGAVRGRRKQKKANKQAEQEAQQQTQTQQKEKLDTFRRAFSSCIDAKGYSVK
jgi:hypothetical protein